MIRFSFISLFLLFSLLSFSQDFEVWTETGVKTKVHKRVAISGELNTRWNTFGLRTLFPQVGVEFKIKKWIKPSVEYRFVTKKNEYGNFKPSSSIRTNLDISESFDRLSLGLRLRYQYSIDHGGGSDYDDDFDQAIRFRPYLKYDINDFPITPSLETEFFLDPKGGINGPEFTKIRYTVGLEYETNNDHGVEIKYRIDQRLGEDRQPYKHILCLSYRYSF